MIPNDSDTLRESATKTLERLADLLDREKMAEQIEAPLDQAFLEYDIPLETDFSHEWFHQVTTDFIKYLHDKVSLPSIPSEIFLKV